MDALSAVLGSLRLTGGIFLEAEFSAPWCVRSQLAPLDFTEFIAQPAQFIAFHFVVEGVLEVSTSDQAAVSVRAGEIVLLPRNDVHLMASGSGVKPVNASELVKPAGESRLLRISHGGGGAPTSIICGFLGTEDVCPLLAALPPLLILDIREGLKREWIKSSLRFAAGELAAGRLAARSVVSRLSETLLVEAVRQYATTAVNLEAGWLRGLKDVQIGRALALMHADLSASWTADSLAREVALSRSVFVERFRDLVGMPPIRYLTRSRLQKAKAMVRYSAKSVREVADTAGYGSEVAFSRAFKREFGISPAQWRQQCQTT